MIVIEVCAASVEDCKLSDKYRVSRIELNSALHLGGLTPSLGLVKQCLKVTTIPMIAMIRPRGGGFRYSDDEYQVMIEDAKALLETGISGLVFGLLDDYGKVDRQRTRTMVELCQQAGKEAVFHRAYDVCNDPIEAIEALIECGVCRVLTSGQQDKAWQGQSLLARLNENYGDKIEFCVGSGVSAYNIEAMIQRTKITQYHGSFKTWYNDPTTQSGTVSYQYSEQGSYDGVGEVHLQEMMKLMKDR